MVKKRNVVNGWPLIQFCRAEIRYLFGSGGIGIRYLKTGRSVSVFRYFPKAGHSVSVFRYFGCKTYIFKKVQKHR